MATYHTLWLLAQSAAFAAGYDSYCLGEPVPADANAEWVRGYRQAKQDLSKD